MKWFFFKLKSNSGPFAFQDNAPTYSFHSSVDKVPISESTCFSAIDAISFYLANSRITKLSVFYLEKVI